MLPLEGRGTGVSSLYITLRVYKAKKRSLVNAVLLRIDNGNFRVYSLVFTFSLIYW